MLVEVRDSILADPGGRSPALPLQKAVSHKCEAVFVLYWFVAIGYLF